MFDAFLKHISNNFPILFKSRVLLAVSGGIDSIVLLHLLKKAGVDFAIAHCNFSLRGKESDQDAKFVEELARALNVPIYIQKFNTKAFALENKVSTQMAARELRYAWFKELCAEHNLSHTVIAHHAQDDLETFLINISRASGIEGLTGMTENSDFILRPLLPFSRDQIAVYAEEHAINWREDSSNSTDNYLRNHLRHHAIPALNEASPDFLTQFKKTQTYLQESATLLEDYTAFLFSKIVTQSFKGYELNIPQLLEVPNSKLILYQLLKGFEFTDWDTIYDLLTAQSGKQVIAGKHRLIRDREVLLLTEHKVEDQEEFKVTSKDSLINIPGLTLKVDEAYQFDKKDNNAAFFDKDQLEFPLTVRKWKEGDIFYPFGMHGKKKISKYFKDNKFSTLDKESTWLLCSGENIIWIVGERTDNRYKIKSGTTKLVKFTVIYD
ncbi:tRNA lysidine(34) synthetase TilS [Leeuwenhoekiella aequorea]|uniref:tRNA lysidine(34) synthetase TilS n=1 Tax=Leeuwenhoekiella aequorea TaxID=283736 RepID=UPI00352FAE95